MVKIILPLLTIFILSFVSAEAKNTVAVNVSCIIPPLVGVNVPEKEPQKTSSQEEKQVITQTEEKFQENTKIILTTVVAK